MPNQKDGIPPFAGAVHIDLAKVEVRALATWLRSKAPSPYTEHGNVADILWPYQRTLLNLMAERSASGRMVTPPRSPGKFLVNSAGVRAQYSGTPIRNATPGSTPSYCGTPWSVSSPKKTPVHTAISDCAPSVYDNPAPLPFRLRPSVLPSRHRACPAPSVAGALARLMQGIPSLLPPTAPPPRSSFPWHNYDPWHNYLRSQS